MRQAKSSLTTRFFSNTYPWLSPRSAGSCQNTQGMIGLWESWSCWSQRRVNTLAKLTGGRFLSVFMLSKTEPQNIFTLGCLFLFVRFLRGFILLGLVLIFVFIYLNPWNLFNGIQWYSMVSNEVIILVQYVFMAS